jgi:pimeloyl-ACP methyl ester carboxylesterase
MHGANNSHLQRAERLLEGKRPRMNPGTTGQIRTLIGRSVDSMAYQFMHGFLAAQHRKGEKGAGPRGLLGEWEILAAAAKSDPSFFFPKPDYPGFYVRKQVKALAGGWIEDIRFTDAYQPIRRSAVDLLERFPENRIMHVRHYRHEEGGHPAVICLHGWGGGNHRIEAQISNANWLYNIGFDVYLYIHPYHGARSPREVRIGAQYHPSTDITRTNEAFLQTAYEVRALVAYHEQTFAGVAGVMGLSLGGYATALVASVAPELAFAVPIMPIADLPALIWSWGEGTRDRKRAEAEGVTFDEFCSYMAVHSPLALSLAIPKEKTMIIAARGDRIVPPAHAEGLWEHWGHPRVHWFPGGHLAHFGRADYWREAKTFWKEIGVI